MEDFNPTNNEPTNDADENLNTGAPMADTDGMVEMAGHGSDPAPQKRKFKLKVDGQEFEEEYGDEDLVKELQLAKASTKRLQDAAQQRNQLNQILELAKNDPMALLRHVGYDDEAAANWAERYLGAHLENKFMSPEERQRRIDEQELANYRAHQQRVQQEREQQESLARRQELHRNIETGLIQAMEKADLPQSPEARTIIMYEALKMWSAAEVKARKNGVENTYSYEKAVRDAKRTRLNDVKSLLGQFDEAGLYDQLGPDLIKKIRREDTKRYRNKNQFPTNRNTSNTAPIQKQNNVDETKNMTPKEFEAYLKGFGKPKR